MEKYYLIEQPPIAEKYTFLVDDISNKVNYGQAKDMDKINYNRKLMGEKFDIELKVGLLVAESKGSTFIFDLGKFVTVLELRADQKGGKMTFFDGLIDMPRSDLNNLLVDVYSQNIADEWFKVQDKILSNYKPGNDIVRLHKPEF